MIFELIFKRKELIKKPWELFFLAILTASLGVVLSLFTFKGSESLVLIFFSIIPLIPVVMDFIKSQEKTLIREEHLQLKKIFFKHFTFIFLGLVIAYTLWFIALPQGVGGDVFSGQIESLEETSTVKSFATLETEGQENRKLITAKHIFVNNFKVMFFVLLTAFLFGAGAIFIIAWNASIIGVFIGGFVKTNINFMQNPALTSIYEIPKAVGKILIHSTFEFGGFFCVAISGSILGLVMVEHFRKKNSRNILIKDSIMLILLGILLIGIGSIIESYM